MLYLTHDSVTRLDEKLQLYHFCKVVATNFGRYNISGYLFSICNVSGYFLCW